MKTSNYILSALAVFVVGSMAVLCIFAKNYKGLTPHEVAQEQLKQYATTTKEYPLPEFSVVVAESESKFRIEQREANSIDITYQISEGEHGTALPAQSRYLVCVVERKSERD